MATSVPTIIEAFLTDKAFIDHTKAINDILTDAPAKVSALTKKAASYFNDVSVYSDVRDPSSRQTTWFAETVPNLIIDGEVFADFVDTINNQTDDVATGVFKLLDKLLYNYTGALTHEELEADLLADADIAAVYMAGSFSLASQILTAPIYYASGATTTANVPAQTTFSLTLLKGMTPTTYVVNVFTSVDAWIDGYNISTVRKVVPPLDYSVIYTASLTASESNILSTASMSATLSFLTTKELFGTDTLSGIVEYSAVLTDTSGNSLTIPFNLLFKGRRPTLTEQRAAIRDELLNSGVGDAAGWEARIPGVFVAGRFYLIPFWDLTFIRPDQPIFPSILDYTTIADRTGQVMEAAGFTDVNAFTNVFPVYYNRMTISAVPDLSGLVDINPLTTLIPDYQSYSNSDEQFAYMQANTKQFATQLNTILAIDATNGDPGIYTPITESLLTFYSFVVEKFEICVITKQCYTDILESNQ